MGIRVSTVERVRRNGVDDRVAREGASGWSSHDLAWEEEFMPFRHCRKRVSRKSSTASCSNRTVC